MRQTKDIHLRLSPKLLARLDALAQEWTDGISRPSRSAVIRRATVLGLEDLEREYNHDQNELSTDHAKCTVRDAPHGKRLEDNQPELEAVELIRAAKQAQSRIESELADVRKRGMDITMELSRRIMRLESIRWDYSLDWRKLESDLRSNRCEFDEQGNNATCDDLSTAVLLNRAIEDLRKRARSRNSEVQKLWREQRRLQREYRAYSSRALLHTFAANPSRYPARGAKGWTLELIEQIRRRL